MCYRLIHGLAQFEGESHTTYGVGCEALVIEDVTFDERAILGFIELCNELQLEPQHLRYAVEDFLAAQTFGKY